MLGKVFKAYDVRALVPKPLNEKLAWQIGFGAAQAIVELAEKAGRTDPMMRHLVVGRDARPTSKSLGDALIDGIRAAGMTVIDVGLVDTPMVYFAVNYLECAGGIQVTASHNPIEYNGFKFCGIGASPIGEGTGLEVIRELAARASRERIEAAGGTLGLVETRDLFGPYRTHLLSLLEAEAPGGLLAGARGKALRVVVDAANGSAGAMVPRVFDGIDGLHIEKLNFEHEGVFAHDPNPLVESNLASLRERVVKHGADFGVAFDGDADRLVVIDECGGVVGGDLLAAWLLEPMLVRNEGAAIVLDGRSSRVLRDRVEALGGCAVFSRVGHVYMKEALARENAIFGGELSGHFYFRDMFGTDSAARTFVSVLGALARMQGPLSSAIEPLRVYAQSGETNFENNDIDEAMAAVIDSFPGQARMGLDGLEVHADDWWANIRASNTEPLLRLNVEGRDEESVAAGVEALSVFLGRRVDH